MWHQHRLRLSPRRRGFHLITSEVESVLAQGPLPAIGLLHLFLQHTSASLCLNENADPDVRADLEMALNRICPQDWPYRHDCEGPDDMPAHIKSMLIGPQLTVPIHSGILQLGTWQGLYLCEHRDHATARSLILTVQGE